MAKRKGTARTRKTARKTRLRARGATARQAKKATRKISRPARKASSRKTATPKARKPASPKRQRREGGRPKPLALQRERRRLRDDETVPGAPSQLGYSHKASGAESGQAMYQQRKRDHTQSGSALTGGEIDGDWSEAYASGEEAPGGDMPTPDQDVVEEIGRALGVEYEDAEELKGAEKIEERDKHRWEYDPASAEDYKDRNRKD